VYTPRSNDPEIKIVDLDALLHVLLSVSLFRKMADSSTAVTVGLLLYF